MANKIEDADQQRAILFSVCGPATYGSLKTWYHPKADTTQVSKNHRNHAEAS